MNTVATRVSTSRFFTEATALGLVVLLAVAIIPVGGVSGSDAVAKTVERGYQILDKGWGTIDVRPLYYLFIAWSVAWGDGSIQSVFFVDRILFAADLAAIYLLGRIAFGLGTALTAFLLCLTAFGLHYAAGLFAGDPSVPLFPLLGLAALVHGMRGVRAWPFFLAGIFFALGVQMKESLLPLLVLPFVVWLVPALRPRIRGRQLLAYLAAVIPILLFFLQLVARPEGVLGDAQGQYTQHYLSHDPLAQRSFALFLLYELTIELPKNLYLYTRHFLLPYFPIAPLMFIAFVTAGWRLLHRGRAAVPDGDAAAGLCVLAAVVLAPGIIIQGEMGERIGHGMPLHMVLYVLTAWWAIDVVLQMDWLEWVVSRIHADRRYIGVAGVSLAVAVQMVFPGRATAELLFAPGKSFSGHFPLTFWRDTTFVNRGRFNDDNRRITEELVRVIPPGAAPLAVGEALEGVTFFARGRLEPKGLHFRTPISQLTEADLNKKVVGLDTYGGFRSFAARYRSIYFFFLEDYERVLSDVDLAYVVAIKDPYDFFRDRLLTGDGARLIAESGETQLYEMRPARRLAALKQAPLWISERFRGDMMWLKDQYPEEFNDVGVQFRRFGLDLAAILRDE